MLREQIPLLQEKVYLDTASLAPLARPVEGAMKGYLGEWGSEGSLAYEGWSSKLEETRKLAASLVNAAPENMAFVSSTSQGVNLAAALSSLSKGDKVLVSEGDFPANVLPFRNLESRGIKVEFLSPCPTPEEVDGAMDREVRLVSLSFVNYRTGYRVEVEEVGKLCSQNGALFHLDAIQGLGVFDIDVKKAGVDFLSSGGYKWLLGPLGSGIFYSKKEHLKKTPYLGWRSVENFEALPLRKYRVPGEGRKFELGNPDFGALLGLGAALRLTKNYGRKKIEKQVLRLNSYLNMTLEEEGYETLSDFDSQNSSGIVSFKAPGVRKERLEAKGVVATVRGEVRFSFHAYNTREDLERALEAVSGTP